MDKKQIRQKMKSQRALLSRERVTKDSNKIWDQIDQMQLYQDATTILLYSSIGNEVETAGFAQAALAKGKKVAYPVTDPTDFTMAFYKVGSLDDLSLVKSGRFSLREPQPDPANKIRPNELTLMIVPGLAFDKSFYRTGYGGGFYDKYISQYPKLRTLGVCYDFQLLETLPKEAYDQPVDQVIMPNLKHERRSVMSKLTEQGKKAKEVSKIIGQLSSHEKNKGLISAADHLIKRINEIVQENKIDISKAKDQGITGALIDRLTLDHGRVEAMVEGIRQIVKLEDPVGETSEMKKRPNGLIIGQRRVPLGVVGIIYEARPNVTADAFALCLKSGNATILRGGKEAIRTNMKIVEIIGEGLEAAGIPKEAIQLVEDTSRETSVLMMKMNGYLDVLIPRGGKGLIKSVIENSTVPVIETGAGNCHVYIDQSADLAKAISIVINAKTHRPGVCNAAETLLVHKEIAKDILPELVKKLQSLRVEVRGDEQVKALIPGVKLAVEEDWESEYLDYILAVKVVADFKEAIDHISTYGTGHSEAIVTESYTRAQKFLDRVDAAAVYVNASTRFTDGSEFGFGAEIGISTQKLHARGPMGLRELTTSKYIIYGDGQIRH